jgi:hypothetical protein
VSSNDPVGQPEARPGEGYGSDKQLAEVITKGKVLKCRVCANFRFSLNYAVWLPLFDTIALSFPLWDSPG